MTRIAEPDEYPRQNRQRPRSARRFRWPRGAAAGVLAAGLIAAAGPAAAECTAGPVTVSTGAEKFACIRNCRNTYPTWQYDARVVYTTGECLALCSSDPRCGAVAISTYANEAGEIEVMCVRLANPARVEVSDLLPTRPGDSATICYPQGIWRDFRFRFDTERLQQDQFRPSFPSGQSPSNRYKP